MIEEKKKMDEEKKNTIIGVIVVLVVIGIIAGGVFYFMHKKDANKSSEFGGISTTIKQYPEIQSGKNVGTYAVVNYDSKKTTNEQIVNYYNKEIKGKKDNYFILLDGKNSILMPVSSYMTENGFIQEGPYVNENAGIKVQYWGTIKGNTIEWKSVAEAKAQND